MRTRVGLLSMAAHAIDDILAMLLIIFVYRFSAARLLPNPPGW